VLESLSHLEIIKFRDVYKKKSMKKIRDEK
jgi:hypothetical protein